MQSLHVPATTVQRVVRLVRWLVPSSSVLMAGVLLTYQWFGSRASRTDVGNAVANVSKAAKEAQSGAHHAASLAEGHAAELGALWQHVVAMRAELLVLRAYGKADAATRSDYIEKAQAFYTLRFDEQLRLHANAPAYAAELALKAEWRPSR